MSKNTLRITKLTTWDPRPGGGFMNAVDWALEDLDVWGQKLSTYLCPGEELEEFLDRPLLGVHILCTQGLGLIWAHISEDFKNHLLKKAGGIRRFRLINGTKTYFPHSTVQAAAKQRRSIIGDLA